MDKLTLISIAANQPRRGVVPHEGVPHECAACCVTVNDQLDKGKAEGASVYDSAVLLRRQDCRTAEPKCSNCHVPLEMDDANP